ncbi:MAG: hypothetical protein R3A13_12000 [Bdellovibrionota bacterium]
MKQIRTTYPELYPAFVWTSFSFAVFGGFLLAAYLALSMGSGWWSGQMLFELIQLHGHLQLFGWIGLLLVGVSLYTLPRLVSLKSTWRNAHIWIFILLVSGIFLRVLSLLIGFMLPIAGIKVSSLIALGMLLESLGIVLYVLVCLKWIFAARGGNNDLRKVGPYFFAMYLGWCVLGLGYLAMGISLIGSESMLLNPEWNNLLNETFVRLVLLPAILGFGVKMLPVFLGLRAPQWPVRKVGILLLLGSFFYLISKVVLILYPATRQMEYLSALGLISISIAVLSFIWFLDALLFRILPERIALKKHRSDLLLQRGRFGDKGEFGRFEFFIIAGFAWISFVALMEATNGLRLILGMPELISSITLRHASLLGGLTHLVLGVSTAYFQTLWVADCSASAYLGFFCTCL